jgi:hypothetical protein
LARRKLLQDNPLLETPLTLEHIKPRLLGHWGTTTGLNFIYVHLNRAIKERDLNMIYIIGPGHGGPGLVAHSYLEGSYTERYPIRSIEYCFQHQGVVVVGTADAWRRVDGKDSPSSVLGCAEKRCEQGIAVKAWPAQPVNRTVATDERGRRAIADQGIVLDVQREVGS